MKTIWELTGKDQLRTCSTEGMDRLDTFETKKGDGRIMKVYEREKPKR